MQHGHAHFSMEIISHYSTHYYSRNWKAAEAARCKCILETVSHQSQVLQWTKCNKQQSWCSGIKRLCLSVVIRFVLLKLYQVETVPISVISSFTAMLSQTTFRASCNMQHELSSSWNRHCIFSATKDWRLKPGKIDWISTRLDNTLN